ncbi:MAG: integrase arm-type DNA-binding domain-containing protein [Planctomycetota bacterium]
MQRFPFTEDRIRKEALPPEPDATTATGKPVKDTIYWDKDVPGFGVRVGRPRTDPDTGKPAPPVRTFIFQRDVRGRTRRFTIGRHGHDETRDDLYTVKRARARAVELLNYMLKGLDPAEEERREEVEGMTLAAAIALHVRSMRARECAERSILHVHQDAERYMPDWLARPLASITRAECMERHAQLTERGKYVANRAMRMLRAAWNTAARANDQLPKCPVVAVTMNKERRRREPITWDALPRGGRRWTRSRTRSAATCNYSSCLRGSAPPMQRRCAGSTSTSATSPCTWAPSRSRRAASTGPSRRAVRTAPSRCRSRPRRWRSSAAAGSRIA